MPRNRHPKVAYRQLPPFFGSVAELRNGAYVAGSNPAGVIWKMKRVAEGLCLRNHKDRILCERSL